MNEFDDRTNLWNYRDNRSPNRPTSSDSSYARRGRDRARAYIAAENHDEHDARNERQYGQSGDWGYRRDDRGHDEWNHRNENGGNRYQRYGSGQRDWVPHTPSDYHEDGYARYGSRQNRHDHRPDNRYDQGTSRWPSELGYPPARDYAAYDRKLLNNHQNSYGSDEHDRGFFERAGDEFLSWFGDRDAQRRREKDQRGRGPKAYVRSDDRIREDVNDRLTDDIWVDASNIEVTVTDGEVTLTGTVDDRRTKRRAEDCVENVSGVKHVQNNLRYASSMRSPAPE